MRGERHSRVRRRRDLDTGAGCLPGQTCGATDAGICVDPTSSQNDGTPASTVFTAALEVAAPVLVALLITDVAFGVVSRVVPQLNVFAVGFPTKVAVALLVVGASLPFTANWISNQLSVSVAGALGALHVA